MAILGVHTEAAPWPFNRMEVGDIIICTHPRAASTAHAYGLSTRKVFSTKKVTNKSTGEVGYRIERLAVAQERTNKHGPKLTRVNGQVIPAPKGHPTLQPRNAPGRKAFVWPFELLPVGGTWTTSDPALMTRAISAAGARNRQATLKYQELLRENKTLTETNEYMVGLYAIKLYKIATKVDPGTRTYLSVTITRTDGVARIRHDRRSKELAARMARWRAARSA